MKTIELGHGYRLVRCDSRNWELEEFRAPAKSEVAGRAIEQKPRWYGCGSYFQRLDAALAHVYEHALRDGGEDAETLAEALERAEGIAASLRSVQTSLLEL